MRRCISITGAAILVAAPVFAHTGARIWIDNVGGKILTYAADNDDEPSIYTPARVFSSELLNFGVFQTDFPGYEVLRDGAGVTSGTTFGFNIAAPLLYYDDDLNIFRSTRSKFGPPLPGPVPQMAVSLGEEVRITENWPVHGFDFFTYIASEDHAHLSYTVLPFDPPFNPPAGVYALPLTLTGTGLANSDPYFILLGKDVAPGSQLFDEAHAVAQAMIDVPADANFDGRVDKADLGRMALNWHQQGTWLDADFNFDSRVDVHDLLILAINWHKGVDELNLLAAEVGLPASAVPEPAAGLLCASAALICRRSRRANSRAVPAEPPARELLHP